MAKTEMLEYNHFRKVTEEEAVTALSAIHDWRVANGKPPLDPAPFIDASREFYERKGIYNSALWEYFWAESLAAILAGYTGGGAYGPLVRVADQAIANLRARRQ